MGAADLLAAAGMTALFAAIHRIVGTVVVVSSLPVLPPTDPTLADPDTRPYFLWWTDATVADLRRHLEASDPIEHAYWLGALLREANTRDVWLFVTPQRIREAWPSLLRHLGRRRELWGFLLDLDPTWPPHGARGADAR